MTPQYPPSLVEKVARALYEHEWNGQPYPEPFSVYRDYWIEAATAALNASGLIEVREALGRIASNGFGFPIRDIDHKRDKEMLAMMNYARLALQSMEKNNEERT